MSLIAGISFVDNFFDKAGMSQPIDSRLDARTKAVGYSYSDIIKTRCNIFLSGNDCAEDVQNHRGKHPKSIPDNRVITGQYSLLQLYSAHGELLLQRTNDAADELRWDVSALLPGVYQLKLSGNHPTVVKKLIRN